MVNFIQVKGSRLFVSDSNVQDAGWWGVLVKPLDPEESSYTLESALIDPDLQSTFVYTATPPNLSNEQDVLDFIKKIDEILTPIIGNRAVIWLPTGDSEVISEDIAKVAPLSSSGDKVKTNKGVSTNLTGDDQDAKVLAQLASGASLTVSDDGQSLLFSGPSIPALTLGGSEKPDIFQPDDNALLMFSGENLGTFLFPIYITRQTLLTNLNWGFQTLIPDQDLSGEENMASDPILYLSAFLPLASGTEPNPTDSLGFNVQVNMVNPNNLLNASGTVFWYTGKNSSGTSNGDTILVSYYRTNYGKTITLTPIVESSNGQEPAGMVFNPGFLKTPLQNGFRFSPIGDFLMDVIDGTKESCAFLMGGLSGPETIGFAPSGGDKNKGYRIRFFINKPAFVPQFPLVDASPVGTPIDPLALLMNDDNGFQSSWATVIAPPGGSTTACYQAAPKGSDLFGKDPVINQTVSSMLGPKNPGIGLPAKRDFCFPLFPMAGYKGGTGIQDVTQKQMEELNREILSPTRRYLITNSSVKTSTGSCACGGSDDKATNITNPTGNIVNVEKGVWNAILLAQVTKIGGTGVVRQMGFTRLHERLQAAFQTDNLFLVTANDQFLGTPANGVFMPPATSKIPETQNFYNVINIEDWLFTASVGQKNNYNDYRNIMIFKGVTGKLTDLVVSPDKWTQKDTFGAPATLNPDGSIGAPDISQLIPLSNWLNQYLQEALIRKNDPYFQNIARIMEDENWTGVLFLKVDISSIPGDLAGIAAGVDDPNNFYAHHLGIEISQINGEEVIQTDASSLFGLVYYVDPDYDDSQVPHAIAPTDLNATYDFTLLTLKALFDNTRVVKFESLAQLVLNRIYSSAVDEMSVRDSRGNELASNVYNAILLEGAYQLNGDTPVYSLASKNTHDYKMHNNVLTDVVVQTALMSTRDDGSVSGQVVSWIALGGYMTFALIKDTSGSEIPLPDFDIFSFGDGEGGLNFNNLGLEIRFSKKDVNPGDKPTQVLTMIEDEITFNTSSSKFRPISLFPNFQMELQGLSSGDADNTPAGQGFATVATAYGLQGVTDKNWHGLVFNLNMGTPGALASKINLSSSLMLGWADDSGGREGNSGYQAVVGLQLPGAGVGGELFSLQTVLKLSVGMIRLDYNPKKDKESFLLLLNEIALKFLGLLKIPPNGSSSFFLFGNPDAKNSTGLGWYAIYNQDQEKPDCKDTTATLAGKKKQIRA